jgi:hypothetical protein
MWENTVEIHNILKEKNYKAKFLTSSIFKKKLTKIILKKEKEKINEKKKENIGKSESNFEKKKKKKGQSWKKNEKREKLENIYIYIILKITVVIHQQRIWV